MRLFIAIFKACWLLCFNLLTARRNHYEAQVTILLPTTGVKYHVSFVKYCEANQKHIGKWGSWFFHCQSLQYILVASNKVFSLNLHVNDFTLNLWSCSAESKQTCHYISQVFTLGRKMETHIEPTSKMTTTTSWHITLKLDS